MTREVRWERMFRDELEAAFAAMPVVYFSYGLCEPHGPQNALGLDTLKAHGICCAAARAGGGVAAPPDYWHVHEVGPYASWGARAVGEVERDWITAVPPWVHFKNVCYHVRAAERIGFKAGIFVTGHYGPNWRDLNTLLTMLQEHVGMRLYGLPDFEANVNGFDGDGEVRGDHAGKVETSLLWALEPECVAMSRLPEEGEPGPHFAMGTTAKESDREVGERMVCDEVTYLTAKAKDLVEAFDRAQPARGLATFGDVERFWAERVMPRLGAFECLKAREAVAGDSRWAVNAKVELPGEG